MRLILMGQQAFGKDILVKIQEQDVDEVVAVYCEPDRPGGPIDPLKELAVKRDVPVFQPARLKDPEVLDTLGSHSADLMVMALVNVFLPVAARDIPKQGSICFHPSLLPLHRGPSALNWPIIMGRELSGFSWFYPANGLDDGDILTQWECPIDPDDTVNDLYLKKIYPAAVDSVVQVCDLIRSGNVQRNEQIESLATYERRCTKRHAKIDWFKPVGQVYNLIRGTNPEPGAWSTIGGVEISIYDCAKGLGDGIAGRIMEISEEGVSIQCVGGRILVKRVKPTGGEQISASEWVSASGIAVGDSLGS